MEFFSKNSGQSSDLTTVQTSIAASSVANSVLTPEQWDNWQRDGFLILRGLLNTADIARVNATVDQHWQNPDGNDHEIDVNSGPNTGKHYKLHNAPPGSRDESYKLNNLFLRNDEIRQVALKPELKNVLIELLAGEPIICNSLNFERGSQQGDHIDTFYMPPPVEGGLVAASLSLDTIDATNGPLYFYRRSHQIPPYRFSHGLLNEIPAESANCYAYLNQEIALRGLTQEEFHGEPGDVFIWHEQLIHGGRPIADFRRTRKSLVIHYWRVKDLPQDQVRRDAAGFYLGHTLRGEIHLPPAPTSKPT